MLVGRGSTKISGSNSTANHTKEGLATSSGALFIHLLYLGNVTDSARNSLALMCCLNAYNKR